MRPGLLIPAALLCALPASGDVAALSDAQIDALTTIDTMPTRAQVDFTFGATNGLAALVGIAKDGGQRFDLQIRAIRTLPQYCTAPGCAGTGHDALVAIINIYESVLPGPLSPRDMVRLRAAVEALGATGSGLASDVHLLAVAPLLRHPNRDVQVATVHALRDLCSHGQCDRQTCTEDAAAVRALRSSTGDTQLDNAINIALQDLAQCDQP
ncbi:MAG TPA: hypothetical protein VIX73_12565 [Kofleriaceae bacterium]|jgi:hypothetical protein